MMHKLSQALSDIEVDCSIVECEGEPCLFVNLQDEFAATCRLKKFRRGDCRTVLWPQPILTVSPAPEAGGYIPAVER